MIYFLNIDRFLFIYCTPIPYLPLSFGFCPCSFKPVPTSNVADHQPYSADSAITSTTLSALLSHRALNVSTIHLIPASALSASQLYVSTPVPSISPIALVSWDAVVLAQLVASEPHRIQILEPVPSRSTKNHQDGLPVLSAAPEHAWESPVD
jgi:hypothetical protein